MSRGVEGHIECPFYISFAQKKITCEGALPCNHRTTHSFKTYADCMKHIYTFCCVDGGKKCPHYKMVASLYEEPKEIHRNANGEVCKETII